MSVHDGVTDLVASTLDLKSEEEIISVPKCI